MLGKSFNSISSGARETRPFSTAADKDATIREILDTVYDALSEKGYNPIGQLVGYILSDDPTYITNHKNARSLICRFDRDDLLDALVRYYFKSKSKSEK